MASLWLVVISLVACVLAVSGDHRYVAAWRRWCTVVVPTMLAYCGPGCVVTTSGVLWGPLAIPRFTNGNHLHRRHGIAGASPTWDFRGIDSSCQFDL